MRKKRIKPAPLKPGDIIGIAAPAGSFDRELLRRGVKTIAEMGFKVVLPPEVLDQKRYLAGSDETRAAVLNSLFADKTIQAIFCARGGFGSARLLDLLDFEIIGSNPKIFAGFSDVSALLAAVFEQTGLITFHAPVVTSLADADQESRDSLALALTSCTKISIRPTRPITVSSGSASGLVRGGNLASLCQLVGTPWQPDFRESLLFLEETNEAPYRIDRMLTQLRLAGCLAEIRGVLLGRFDNCGQSDVIHEIVTEHFLDHGPILAGLEIGHNGTNQTLPLGLEAVLDADQGTLLYQEPAVLGS